MPFWMVCMAAMTCLSIRRLEDAGKDLDKLIDLLLLDDERRRERDDVAGCAHQESAVERLDEARMGAFARFAGDGLQLDGADQPDIADVDDMRQALQRMHRLLPIGRKLRGAREQAILLVDLKRRDGGGAS